jgi:PHS family inorganic phosphate transporter-like MFS transporter
MLSSLFFMQAVGALIANIVTVAVVYLARDGLPVTNKVCDAACIETVDRIWRWIVGIGAIPPALAIFLRWWIPESPRYTIEIENDHERASRDVQGYFGTTEGLLHSPSPDQEVRPESTIVAEDISRRSSNQAPLAFGETLDNMEMKDTNVPESVRSAPKPPMPTKESWKEWYTGFYHYLIVEGNWTDLAGTSLTWLFLDFAFYCLSVNNPKVLNKLWNTEGDHPVYSTLMESGYRAMIAVSLGGVIGGALFICMARYRWALQVYGFWMLAVVFIIVGICFVTLLGTRYFAAVIVLYSICSIFFNLGPNTSTYVLAAECFPTKYRCTCHGISAAAGKIGAIFAQLFLQYAKINGVGVNEIRSTWLGWVLLM